MVPARWIPFTFALTLAGCASSLDPEVTPVALVEYGAETWHRPAPGDGRIDVTDVIERVRHAIRRDGSGVPRVVSPRYTATFERAMTVEHAGASLTLRTQEVAIGKRRHAPDEEPWAIVGNTAQRRVGPIIEHHEARADGVEVTWVLRERPSARAELVVDATIEAAGLTFTRHDETGVHFADDANAGARMRIAPATLVDATGRRWSIVPSMTGEKLRWRVPPALVAQATFPVALDPLVGPELATNEPVATSGAPEKQALADVASSGDVYLVVWADERGGSDIFGARVSSQGVVLDPVGIPIAVGFLAKRNPAVTSNGSDFLVAWDDVRTGTRGIYATVVTATGEVPDPSGTRISTSGTLPAVAWNGSGYLVVWEDNRNNTRVVLPENTDIYAARLGPDGAVLDLGGIPVAMDLEVQGGPAVASDGADYLVSWYDYRTTVEPATVTSLFATRVTADGDVSHPGGLGIDAVLTYGGVNMANELRPSLASDGTDYLLVWGDRRNASVDVFGARLSGAGAVIDTTAFRIGGPVGMSGMPAVAGTAQRYFVAWSAASTIRGARVLLDGNIEGSEVTVASRYGFSPRVATDGHDFLVAWDDQESALGDSRTGYDIHAARVRGSDGAALDPLGLALGGPNAQYAPAVAGNAAGFFVAWQDNRNGTYDVYGARLSPTGELRDPEGIALGVGAGDQLVPSVAASTAGYLVAWRDHPNPIMSLSDIEAARVTNAGDLLDATNIAVTTHARGHRPRAASDGTNYFVAWDDFRSGASGIYGTPIAAADGAVLHVDGTLIGASTSASRCAVASNGVTYGIAWTDNSGVHGTLVAPSTGAVLGSALVAAGGTEPAVASNGTDYFVAWTQWPPLSDHQIYGKRIAADGMQGAVVPITVASGTQEKPAVASARGDFLVAWRDGFATTDVRGTRVTPAGLLRDLVPLELASQLDNDLEIALAASGDMYLLIYRALGRAVGRLISVACGDGVRDVVEECDDGDTFAGDGCSASCTREAGYTCDTPAQPCEDIDECTAGTDDCATGTTCTNTAGSFACEEALDAGIVDAGIGDDGGIDAFIEDGGFGDGSDAGTDGRGDGGGDDDGPGSSGDGGACNAGRSGDPSSALWVLVVVALLRPRRQP